MRPGRTRWAVLLSEGGGEGPGYGLCVSPHYAWVQKLFSVVPGARGYLRREKLREADILVRRYAAERISRAAGLLRSAAGSAARLASRAFFAMTPSLTPLPQAPRAPGPAGLQERLMEEARRLDELASDVLYADAGWAPVSAVQAIREDEILALCKLDDSLIGLSEALEEAARRVAECVDRGDASCTNEHLEKLREAEGAVREVLDRRKALLAFITAQKGAAGQAREALGRIRGGIDALWEKAKSLAARIMGR